MTAAVATAALLLGCARAPSPLTPTWSGSIGLPHRGVLTGASDLPGKGDGYDRLRDNGRSFGTARLVGTIRRAAKRVAFERPGSHLRVGDLSAATGGQLSSHASHRTGRDADLLFYLTTPEGAPVRSPGFVHVEADGLAWDGQNRRFLRFDVEREWLLVKALLHDDDARVQWLFVSRVVRAMLLEWALARGETPETILRAAEALAQPRPGGPHDDHLHLRVACADDEVAHGCEPSGPERRWIRPFAAQPPEDDAALALALATPLNGPRTRHTRR